MGCVLIMADMANVYYEYTIDIYGHSWVVKAERNRITLFRVIFNFLIN